VSGMERVISEIPTAIYTLVYGVRFPNGTTQCSVQCER